jgi:hypothetical protein
VKFYLLKKFLSRERIELSEFLIWEKVAFVCLAVISDEGDFSLPMFFVATCV